MEFSIDSEQELQLLFGRVPEIHIWSNISWGTKHQLFLSAVFVGSDNEEISPKHVKQITDLQTNFRINDGGK